MPELTSNFQTRICGKLNYLIAVKKTCTYKEMVDFCNIPSPLSIRKLTDFLSLIMIEDINNKRPIRSALVVSKIPFGNNIYLPSVNFFETANEYGIYFGDPIGEEIIRFHSKLKKELFK